MAGRRAAVPRQGDILLIALDPTAGTEMQGTRPVLVLSNATFNSQGRALVAPITQGGNIERVRGWSVSLMGAGTSTQGVAVVSQCRILDFVARNAKRIDGVSQVLIDEALAKLEAMVAVEWLDCFGGASLGHPHRPSKRILWEQFHRESRAMHRINHDGIVPTGEKKRSRSPVFFHREVTKQVAHRLPEQRLHSPPLPDRQAALSSTA